MYNDMYGSTYGTDSLFDSAFAGTAIMGLSAGIMIFSLILSLISIISYWKLFVKAGKPGWASIVPIYNTIVMIEIAKLPIWYFILFFVPIVNIFALFKINIEISKKFGKSTGYGVGMTLIPIIFIPMLAFSDNVYEENNVGNNTVNNTFDATNVINNENNVNTAENNTLENNIPVNNIQEDKVNQNNIVEPSTENILSGDINSMEVQNEIPVAPVFTEQENVIVEPVIEENSAQEQIIFNDTVNAFNSIPEIPEINNEAVESIEPAIVEPPLQEPSVVEPVQNETLNAFNTIPMPNEVENVVVSDMNSNDTIPLTNEVNNSKRVCKNCGNELPSIVSICPNCGTDNE